MTMINLTIHKSPRDFAAMLDRLRDAPVSDVFAAFGLPPVQVARTASGLVAFVGDGPNSAEVTYARAPMLTPFDASRTDVRITTHDREGRALAVLLTAALEA